MAAAHAEFVHDEIRILGRSVAGEESWYALPELNVGFEFGRAPQEIVSIDHIFLSHGHMDHAAGVAYYFAQRLFIDNEPGHLYLPHPLVQPVRDLLAIWGSIDGNEPPGHVEAAVAGFDIAVRRDLVVRPFEVNHPCRTRNRTAVTALGFAVIDVRKKLLDEFHGLSGPELVELKKKGVEITRRVEVPLVAYCGDTAPGDFLGLDYVRDARVLLLECTFIDPDHVGRARAGNHMHITDLRRVLPTLRNERILLTHLTRRTFLLDAREALRRELDEADQARVSFLMEHRKRRKRSG